MSVNVTAAIAVGFIIFFAAGSAFIMTAGTSDTDDLDINIIAKANINGSGIFADRPLSIAPANQTEINEWGGLVFMTPGPGSIQHYMLGKFITEDLKLKYAMYKEGVALMADTVYWVQIAPKDMKELFLNNLGTFNGGFPWEPFYSDILINISVAEAVASSGELEENHPCCMVAARTSYLQSNEGAVLRFLSAYTEALEWVNEALSNPGSADYLKLLDITSQFSGVSPATLVQAFGTLTYMYDLVDNTGVASLEEYTSNLVVSFESLGLITKHVDDPTAFANQFINHKYLDKILTDGRTEEYPSQRIKIRVGHLGGDIHQIGFVVGMKMNIFDKYGIDLVTILYGNGPGVMQAFQLGIIDIGILGLPPAVMNTANFR